MKRFALAWLTTAVVFAGIDAIWLTFVSPNLYPPLIGEVLSGTVDLPPAIAFYLIYTASIVLLAVRPALEKGGLPRAALHGAILGLAAYATYDLTNQSTLKVWSTVITLADLAWGTAVSAIAATAACWVAGKVR